MAEVASTTTTNTNTTTLPFTVEEYIIYNDGVDNNCFITIINTTYAKVTVKYSINKIVVEDISWIAYRISSILDEVHLQSGTNRNAQATDSLPPSLTSKQRKRFFYQIAPLSISTSNTIISKLTNTTTSSITKSISTAYFHLTEIFNATQTWTTTDIHSHCLIRYLKVNKKMKEKG